MVEHALIFASIIIGLAVAEMLFSLHGLLDRRDKVRWDWLPLTIALIILLFVVLNWWIIASTRAQSLTIGEFLPYLIQLILIFLLAAAALPRTVPSEGIDLTARYENNRSYLWTLFSLSLGWGSSSIHWEPQSRKCHDLARAGSYASGLVLVAAVSSMIFIKSRR
jgi:hypothetical protein